MGLSTFESGEKHRVEAPDDVRRVQGAALERREPGGRKRYGGRCVRRSPIHSGIDQPAGR
jgi:hypothetical protein